jgi:hypothetical protein
MGLREDILNRPDLAEAVAARDCETLAAAMSVGRIRAVSHEVGERGILDALGPIQGDAFLSALENIKTAADLPPPLQPCFGAIRRGVAWLKTSGLDVGAPTTRLLLDGLAGAGVLPQADVNKVKALAERPDSVGVREVAEALFNDDGSAK